MKKKIISLSLILIISAICFLPFSQQETILIKAPFLNIYSLLADAGKWEKWRPDLRKAFSTDSNKISMTNGTGSFVIKDTNLELGVKFKGTTFDINESLNGKNTDYSYTLIPVPDKFLNKTNIIVDQKTNAINYLIGKFWAPSFSGTRIADFKNFMETDSLRYGFTIFKTGVPESNLIVMRREVLTGDKFTEGAIMLAALQQYVKHKNLKQMYPVIAQFLPKGKDSVQVNIGLFIDKEVSSGNGITFTRMPKGGPLYAARFKGQFLKRGKVYDALKQYFINHTYQTAILPFETYLNNKLPANDNDLINIQVDFPTYPSGKRN